MSEDGGRSPWPPPGGEPGVPGFAGVPSYGGVPGHGVAGGYGPPAPPPRGGAPRWMAILALVLSVLALLSTLAPLLIFGLLSAGGDDVGGLGGDRSTGQARIVSGAVSGDSLTRDVTDALGPPPGTMTCPDTPRVAQGVVTVCHATVDKDVVVSVVVVFEDATGRYTALMA